MIHQLSLLQMLRHYSVSFMNKKKYRFHLHKAGVRNARRAFLNPVTESQGADNQTQKHQHHESAPTAPILLKTQNYISSKKDKTNQTN